MVNKKRDIIEFNTSKLFFPKDFKERARVDREFEEQERQKKIDKSKNKRRNVNNRKAL